ncbi:YidH family protein [Thermodesulfitimonas sp.]
MALNVEEGRQKKVASDQAARAHVRAHLANERTFLAWIRTCLGLLAFGFLLVRWVAVAAAGPWGVGLRIGGRSLQLIGEGLMGSAAALMVLATVRFAVVRRQIIRGVYRPAVALDFLAVGFLLFVVSALIYYCHCFR